MMPTVAQQLAGIRNTMTKVVIPGLVFLGVVSSGAIVVRDYRQIDWRAVWRTLPYGIVGTLIGLWLFKSLDANAIEQCRRLVVAQRLAGGRGQRRVGVDIEEELSRRRQGPIGVARACREDQHRAGEYARPHRGASAYAQRKPTVGTGLETFCTPFATIPAGSSRRLAFDSPSLIHALDPWARPLAPKPPRGVLCVPSARLPVRGAPAW